MTSIIEKWIYREQPATMIYRYIFTSALSLALTLVFSCGLLSPRQAVAAHSGIIVQTKALTMQGKRKQADEQPVNHPQSWDNEKITVTNKIIFTGKRPQQP